MKKLIFTITLMFITITSFVTNAAERTDDLSKISNYALKQFARDFKAAEKISWDVERDYVKASFEVDDKKMAALYDIQGTYLGAVEYLSYEQIPEKARLDIEKQYKNYDFSSALKIVSRPYGSHLNDVGTYWVNLSNNVKNLFLNISPSLQVAFQTSTFVQTNAKY